MYDYTDAVFESLVEEMSEETRLLHKQLVAEATFALSALEEGHIDGMEYISEATAKELMKKAENALKVFLDKINSAFTAVAAKFFEAYAEKLDAKADQIKKKAESASIDLAPYWKPNYEADLAVVKKVFDEAFRYPYDDNDIGFIKDILPSIDGNKNYTVDDYNKWSSENSMNLRNMIKNRFRFGEAEPDNNNIKKETLKGSDLQSKVETMIKYAKAYKSFVGNVRKSSDVWKNKAKTFQSQVSESVTLAQDTYLMIEGKQLRDTDLSLLEGFNLLPVTEQDGGDGPTNSQNKDEGNGSLTQVKDNNEEDKKENGENGDNNGGGTKNKTSTARYKLADKFCRLVYTSYIFSVEERFVVYIKAMETILGESLKKKSDNTEGDNNNNDQQQENK